MELMRAALRRGEAVGQSSSSSSKNFKVAVRVRPMIEREWEAGESQVSGVRLSPHTIHSCLDLHSHKVRRSRTRAQSRGDLQTRTKTQVCFSDSNRRLQRLHETRGSPATELLFWSGIRTKVCTQEDHYFFPFLVSCIYILAINIYYYYIVPSKREFITSLPATLLNQYWKVTMAAL